MKTFLVAIQLFIVCVFYAQTEYVNPYSPLHGVTMVSDSSNSKHFKINALLMPPTNDNCASATLLTAGAALLCGQTDATATQQVGECLVDYAANTEVSVWYRFTATNAQMVLDFMRTNVPTNPPSVHIYGPFASGAGCLPACTSTVYSALQSGDPGSHILLTGLSTTGNNSYLVQIQGNEKNPDPNVTFCIGIANKASNSVPTAPAVINNCGTTFNGSTLGGYYNSGTGLGFSNLDGNAATTCGSCGTAGADVSYVINNVSWFSFCTATTGTYNVSFDVTSCVFSGLNSGAQMAILTGTTTALTNIAQAPSPTYPADPVWTSSNFALAANGCAYMVVDGFAGDACSYSYVLSNVAGGCILLPVELLHFTGKSLKTTNELQWATATEKNSYYFDVEKSANGIDFEFLSRVAAAGNSEVKINYHAIDETPHSLTYYRLKQVDADGKSTLSNIIAIEKDFDKLSNIIVNYENLERINLFVYASKQAYSSFELFAADGRLVLSNNLIIESGRNTYSIKKMELSNGIYLAKINVNGRVLTQKIIIQ